MRIVRHLGPPVVAAFAAFESACGLEQLSKTGSTSSATSDAGTDGSTATTLTGAGCGVESGSGAQLCVATSACPSVVADTQALPHCGFRLKAGASELVCACGDSLCPMGVYSTCAQAAALLTTQTEAQVCTQLAEGRCSTVPASPAPSSSAGSSSCDRACLQECGGGGACASICGC
jgi:hypothetical protein